LYIFTFYTPSRVQELLALHQAHPQQRTAQKVLAEKVVAWLGTYTNLKEQLMRMTKETLYVISG
jgi:tyrosyl-tRNA synthetase